MDCTIRMPPVLLDHLVFYKNFLSENLYARLQGTTSSLNAFYDYIEKQCADCDKRDEVLLPEHLRLKRLDFLGRVSKSHMPKNKDQHPDPVMLDFLAKTGRQIVEFQDYVQTDPDFFALWKDFIKYDKEQPPVDDEAFDQASVWLVRHFRPYCMGSGIASHEDCVRSWEAKSSPGWPWNLFYPTTKEFLAAHRDDLEAIYAMFMAGQSIGPVWQVSPKHELRSREKVNKRKIRSFTAAPKHFTYVGQRLCLDFNNRFYNACGKTWSRVGGTPFNQSWNDMMRKLCRFGGKQGVDVVKALELDASQYDSSLFSRVLRLVEKFRVACYVPRTNMPTREEYAEAMHRLYTEIIESVVVLPGGWVLMKRGGNPSGSLNTVVDNTLCLFVLFAYVMILIHRDLGLQLNYEDFVKHVEAVLYGDDNTVSFSDEMAPRVTSDLLVKHSSDIGVTLRPEYPDFRSPIRLKFLNMETRLVGEVFVPVANSRKMCSSMVQKASHPLTTFVRLNGLRLIGYWAPAREIVDEAIDFMKRMYASVFDLVDPNEQGITGAIALSSYLPDARIEGLYLGRESYASYVAWPYVQEQLQNCTCAECLGFASN